MNIVINGNQLGGTVSAVPSKSYAHRALICAFLSGRQVHVVCPEVNEDILATVRCLCALGGEIQRTEDGFLVCPEACLESRRVWVTQADAGYRKDTGTKSDAGYRKDTGTKSDAEYRQGPEFREIVLDCGESGSTLRFLLPVAAALGVSACFTGSGRLPERPLKELCDCLRAGGVSIDRDQLPVRISGRLRAGKYSLPSNVSSQYFSGMLMALSVLDGESRTVTERKPESFPYIQMTMDVLQQLDIHTQIETTAENGMCFRVPAHVQGAAGKEMRFRIEGDWSNAAPWLCMGAVGKRPVTVNGLNPHSSQGDRAVLDILRSMGASATIVPETDADRAQSGSANENRSTNKNCSITVSAPAGALLQAVDIDARDIPDLIPVIGVTCAFCEGTSRIRGAGRLRLKESDRIAGTAALLKALGIAVTEYPDGLEIIGREGCRRDESTVVDAANDHRLVMAAACVSAGLDADITILGAEAVAKSYPSFFDCYKSIGGAVCEKRRDP